MSARRFRFIFLLVTIGVLAWQVVIPPFTGIADNGDFFLVSGPFGLVPATEDPNNSFSHIVPSYKRTAPLGWISKQMTSERLMVVAPFLLNFLVSKDGTFDIRLLGIAHAALLAFTLWLAVPIFSRWSNPLRIGLAILLLLVLCDAMYVVYCNSFYADAGSMLYFLLSAVLFLRLITNTGDPELNRPALYLACALLLTSKTQHAPLALFIVALLLWHHRALRSQWRGIWIGTGAVALSGLIALLIVPPSYRTAAFYNVVFFDLVPHASTPAAALNELQFDPGWAQFSNTNAFSPNSGMRRPEFPKLFGPKISAGKIALYYASHPDQLQRRIGLGLAEGSKLRPDGYGNFTKASGVAPFAISESFALWSKAKAIAFQNRVWLYLAYAALPAILAAIFATRYRRTLIPGLLVLFSMATTELVMASLFDAMDDTRHLLIFNLITDLLFLISAAALARQLFSMPRFQATVESVKELPQAVIPGRARN